MFHDVGGKGYDRVVALVVGAFAEMSLRRDRDLVASLLSPHEQLSIINLEFLHIRSLGILPMHSGPRNSTHHFGPKASGWELEQSSHLSLNEQ